MKKRDLTLDELNGIALYYSLLMFTPCVASIAMEFISLSVRERFISRRSISLWLMEGVVTIIIGILEYDERRELAREINVDKLSNKVPRHLRRTLVATTILCPIVYIVHRSFTYGGIIWAFATIGLLVAQRNFQQEIKRRRIARIE